MSWNWVLVIAGALLILLEVVLGAISGFDFLLIGTAVLLGGVLGLVTNSITIGTATAGVLALVYVFLGRRHIRNRLGRHDVPTNTDKLLGRSAQVVEELGLDRYGRVRIDGEEWRATAASNDPPVIEAGRTVLVERIDGVTLYVRAAATGGSNR